MQHYPKATPLYVDPISKTPLYVLVRQEVADLNHKMQAGKLQNLSGAPLATLMTSGLYSPHMKLIYPIFASDMASFLMSHAIPASGFEAQPEITAMATRMREDSSITGTDGPAPLLPAELPAQVTSLHIEGAPLPLMKELLQKDGRIWLTSASPQKLRTMYEQVKKMEQDLDADTEVRCFLSDPEYLPFAEGSLDGVWQHAICVQETTAQEVPAGVLSKFLTTGGWLWFVVSRQVTPKTRALWRSWTKGLPTSVKQVTSMLVGAGRTPVSLASQALQGQSRAFSAKGLKDNLKNQIADAHRSLFDQAAATSPQKTELQLSRAGLKIRKSAVFSGSRGPQQWFLLQKS